MDAVGRSPALPAGDGAWITVNTPSGTALLDALDDRVATGAGCAVATLNLDHLVKLRRSEAFRRAYLATDFVVADGNYVVLLARLAGAKVTLTAGSDLVRPLCALAARKGAPLALYGASPDSLERAATQLEASHEGLKISLKRSPDFGFDPEGTVADEDIARIHESGARLCLVALGAPKQEVFAARARAGAPNCVFVSVGAGVDFVAGAQKRAHRWVRRLTLEWLWRMLSNPRRLGRRYIACALYFPRFAIEILLRRLTIAATAGRSAPEGGA